MSGTGASIPYIKDEPEDLFAQETNRFMHDMQQFSVPQAQQQHGHYGNNGSINPNDLSMMSSSYNSANFNNIMLAPSHAHTYTRGVGAIGDDELLDGLDPYSDLGREHSTMPHGSFADMGDYDFNNINQNNFGLQQVQNGTAAMSISQQGGFSSNQESESIHSTFVNTLNFQPQLQPQQRLGTSMPISFPSSPLAHDGRSHGTPRSRTTRPGMLGQRKGSSTRSPLNTHTPIQSLNGLDLPSRSVTIGTPTHQENASAQWVPSVGSYPGTNTQFSAPAFHSGHQASDVLKNTSTPPKHNSGGTAVGQADLKRRKRRESHNQVERRRRDHINERIQDLSHLAPAHRLEDDKVRKTLANNSPLSPMLGSTSMSPPQATSSLAGSGFKRASGSITQGLPLDDKDKGPNKGDILTGSVSWIRDLLWLAHTKMQQEEELAEYIRSLGGKWPFEPTESEKRMRTELLGVFASNNISDFGYSRAPGSGLRVPKHTDLKGDLLDGRAAADSSSLSPDVGNLNHTGLGGTGQYWSGDSGPGSTAIMEDDEVLMDL